MHESGQERVSDRLDVVHRYDLSHEETAKKILEDVLNDALIHTPLGRLRERVQWKYAHTVRVGLLALDLALENGAPLEDLRLLGRSALLHDTGIDDEIVDFWKSEEHLKEFDGNIQALKERHVRLVADYCVANGLEKEVYVIARHHERFDFDEVSKRVSYPRNGLQDHFTGEDTRFFNQHLETLADYLAISDTFEGIVSRRPYKDRWSLEEIEAELDGFRGDKELVSKILERFPKERAA